jgi:hypothetical protein
VISTLDERAIAGLRRYLSDAADRRKWVSGPQPLHRSVVIHAETWRPWLDGRKALHTDWSAIAVSALDDLPVIDEGSRLDKRRVDRSTLAKLSAELAADPTDERRVRLLVTTLLWGSGTSNGRGPRYAARTLRDERLAPALANTAALVASGHLAGAHKGFRVRGIGPSFFTKWFWAVGLATTAGPRPLILDTRVAQSLRRLTGEEWNTTDRGAADRYADFVERVDHWARALASDHDLVGVDAEKVEYLLFDRAPGCLNDCLADR